MLEKRAIDDPEIRRRLPPEERRGQILAAAIDLMTDRGLAFNTRELSERLGISHPLLFRYFKSKEEIVDAVFQTVFIGRFSPDMRAAMTRRTDDVIGKWTAFYRTYAPKIFDRTWIRIFILSALQEEVISRRYFDLVIIPIMNEMADDTERFCFGKILPKEHALRTTTLELAWMTHSSLFYSGLRRWVYNLEVPDDIALTMEMRIKVHFEGSRVVLKR
jgi:AcrR family transcriptional regulator